RPDPHSRKPIVGDVTVFESSSGMFQQQNTAGLAVMDLARLERRLARVSDHYLLVVYVIEDVAILDRSLRALEYEYATHLPAVHCTVFENRIGAFAYLHIGVSVVEDLTAHDEGRTVFFNLYSHVRV